MKFKALFLVFNIVLLFSFITVFFMPLFIVDSSFFGQFWAKNWYLCLVFLFLIVGVNAVFAYNWKILALLEKQDWPALSHFLETRVYTANKVSVRNCRLLLESLFILGDFDGIRKLDSALVDKAPRVREVLSPRLCASYLLAGDKERVTAIADTFAQTSGENAAILRFYGAFARINTLKHEIAIDSFKQLASDSEDPVLRVVSGYLWSKKGNNANGEPEKALRGKVSEKLWDKESSAAKKELEFLVFSSLIDDAGKWFRTSCLTT